MVSDVAFVDDGGRATVVTQCRDRCCGCCRSRTAERLDVTPLVANFAEEHRGNYRNRLRRLALRLADGTPLVDALEQSPDVLSDEAVLAIRFATQTGTLSPTYRYLVENHDATTDRVQSNLRQTFYYSVGTLLILVLSLSFLIVFIVPTIAAVREEFLSNEIGAECLGRSAC